MVGVAHRRHFGAVVGDFGGTDDFIKCRRLFIPLWAAAGFPIKLWYVGWVVWLFGMPVRVCWAVRLCAGARGYLI